MLNGLSSGVDFADNFNTKLTIFFQTIYDQELDGQPNIVREKVPFQLCRKAMQEFRSRRIPVSPDSMQELCAKLQAGEYPPAYQCLYQGHCTWDMPALRRRSGRGRSGRSTPLPSVTNIKQGAVIFGDADLIKNISEEAPFFFADATFRCTPRTARVLSLRASQVI